MKEHNGHLYDVYYKDSSGNRHSVRYFGYDEEDAESLFNSERRAGDEIIIIVKVKK